MHVKKTISDAFALLRHRRDENQKAMRTHLHQHIVDAARAKLAGREFELTDAEADTLLVLLENEGLTAEDFELNVTVQVASIENAAVAAQLPALREAAARLDAETKKYAQDIWQQHVENLKRLREMEFECATANTLANRAVVAESNHLAAGEVTAAEREAAEQKTAVSRKIAEARMKLTKCRPHWLTSSMAASVAEFPVLAIIESEREIEARKRSARPDAPINVDGIARAEKTIKVARAAVSEIEKEIAKLERQGDAIDKQLRELAACRPFELVRSKRVPANV